jgi:flagellar biosynthesis component FlhA
MLRLTLGFPVVTSAVVAQATPVADLTVGGILSLIGTAGGWGLLVLFVVMSATKKVAWWYQIEERDELVKKAEAREAEARKREDTTREDGRKECEKWERLYIEAKDLMWRSVTAVETVATTPPRAK